MHFSAPSPVTKLDTDDRNNHAADLSKKLSGYAQGRYVFNDYV